VNTVYNRYIPQSDGSFQRNRINDQRSKPASIKQEKPPHIQNCPPPEPGIQTGVPSSCNHTSATGFLKQLLPKDFDTGDLLIVLLLLLMAGDCEEEKSNALLTLALYFFL